MTILQAPKLSASEIDTLAAYPALAPPPGVTPNFDNSEDQNRPFFGVISLLLAIMSLFIINRTYVKTFLIRKYSWDDCKSNESYQNVLVVDTNASDNHTGCSEYINMSPPLKFFLFLVWMHRLLPSLHSRYVP